MGARPSPRAPGPGMAQRRNLANGGGLGNRSTDPQEIDKMQNFSGFGGGRVGGGTEGVCE